MARKIRWFKTDTMPNTWQPDSIYIIEDGDFGEGYVTDKNGVPKELGNSIMINQLIQEVLAGGGGANDTLVGTAGEILGGGKLVYLSGGKFYLYNANNIALADLAFGITKGAAAIDADVSVQYIGIFTEVGLGLTPNIEYYAGINGLLTNNPTYATVTSVGIAITNNSIKIEIQSSIIKA